MAQLIRLKLASFTQTSSSRFRRAANAALAMLAVAFGSQLALAAKPDRFRDIRLSPERQLSGESAGALRADAKELSDLLKITPMVERLRATKGAGQFANQPLPRNIQQMRLLCLWKILLASQEVRKASADLDEDLALSNASLERLAAKRNMTINMINTINFAQGGTIGVIKQSMGLHGMPVALRQELAIPSFGTSVALGTVNLFVPHIWYHKIGTRNNSLSYYLTEGREPPDADQSYLWKYLNCEIPGDGDKTTRRALLVKHWQSFCRLDTSNIQYLKRLSAAPDSDEDLHENIKTLQSRINLLHDLKTHVEEFDGSLFELQQAIAFNR